MSVKELMQICFSHRFDGRQTDVCVRGVGVNLLQSKRPVVSIDMDTPSDLLRMMQCADDMHIFIEGGIFHFNALYKATEKFPAARVYLLKTRDLMQVGRLGVYFQKHGLNLRPVDGNAFARLIDAENYLARYETWHKRWTANSKTFKGLLDGRVRNTAVEKGVWLSADGGCLICGEKTNQMSTATLIGKSGLMIGFQLCHHHEGEAKNHSTLLEYVSEKMGVPWSFVANAKVVRHDDHTIAMSCEAIRCELECEIEKVEANTITAVRKSGFRLILRQDALNDYAYNIQDPDRKPVSRIDSANHHHVDYGPDHVHPDLSKAQKNIVASSFTYGFAIADLKAIKRLVEDAESCWSR